ncbi:hypothetical protein COLO4_33532 [Corchorus olitorius]|uniref:Uncharacterized protein n=1 Tax=Corchorus olitorius TaxID=93759 RepID=A0A1R3GSR1_9ROSI|nr:hypothetical protein COLO4_33532 [Corchorus olitorius]
MVSEDFSFPKITNPLPQFTFSPSLWRVSSLVYPENHNMEDDDECHVENEDHDKSNHGEKPEAITSLQRKSYSFSCLENDDEDMEKMDMLWEDFNEELKRVSSLRSGSRKLEESSSSKSAELYYVWGSEFKVSKAGGGIGSCNGAIICRHQRRQRYSMLTVMKSLKKIFSLRNLV